MTLAIEIEQEKDGRWIAEIKDSSMAATAFCFSIYVPSV